MSQNTPENNPELQEAIEFLKCRAYNVQDKNTLKKLKETQQWAFSASEVMAVLGLVQSGEWSSFITETKKHAPEWSLKPKF